jgi:hypothetical protein
MGILIDYASQPTTTHMLPTLRTHQAPVLSSYRCMARLLLVVSRSLVYPALSSLCGYLASASIGSLLPSSGLACICSRLHYRRKIWPLLIQFSCNVTGGANTITFMRMEALDVPVFPVDCSRRHCEDKVCINFPTRESPSNSSL